MEAKAFLADVFDYDYHNEAHRDNAKSILKIICGDSESCELSRVQQFFALPNFVEIADLEHINSFDALARGRRTEAPAYEAEWPVQERDT